MEPNLCFPYAQGCRTIHGSGQSNRDHTLNKQIYLLTGPQLGSGLTRPSLFYAKMSLGIVLAAVAPGSIENNVFL